MYHDRMPFATHDHNESPSKCALRWQGAWWYNSCHESNLNGYNLNADGVRWGLTWNSWRGAGHSLGAARLALYPSGGNGDGNGTMAYKNATAEGSQSSDMIWSKH